MARLFHKRVEMAPWWGGPGWTAQAFTCPRAPFPWEEEALTTEILRGFWEVGETLLSPERLHTPGGRDGETG